MPCTAGASRDGIRWRLLAAVVVMGMERTSCTFSAKARAVPERESSTNQRLAVLVRLRGQELVGFATRFVAAGRQRNKIDRRLLGFAALNPTYLWRSVDQAGV